MPNFLVHMILIFSKPFAVRLPLISEVVCSTSDSAFSD